MTFHDILLPEKFSNGSQLGPSWGSSVVETANARFVSQTRTTPRWRYDLVKSVLRLDTQEDRIEAIYELQQFYNAVGGAAGSFRLRDPYDYSTAEDGRTTPTTLAHCTLVGATDGSNRIFQLAKTYTRGTASRSRIIGLPRSGTVVVFVDGVAESEGPDWSVDYGSGRLTLSPTLGATSGLSVHAGCLFDVPVAFEPEADQWLAIEGNDNIGSVSSLPVAEVPNSAPTWDLPFLGGYTDHGAITANVQVTLANGRHQKWSNATGTVHGAFLPPKNSITALGGPVFLIELDAGSASRISIQDGDLLTEVTKANAGDVVRVALIEVSGARQWRAYT